jgi:hypothetical protein
MDQDVWHWCRWLKVRKNHDGELPNSQTGHRIGEDREGWKGGGNGCGMQAE